MKNKTFKCSECGKTYECVSKLTTGYGTNHISGQITCFNCCAKTDIAFMEQHGYTTLYWDGKEITNWPGTLRIKPIFIRQGCHNIAGTRTTVWFNFMGRRWWGVIYGENTQILHCKQTVKHADCYNNGQIIFPSKDIEEVK